MRDLRQKRQNDLEAEKIKRKIQPNQQKKEAPQSPMGQVGFGQKSQSLRPLHKTAE